MNSRERSFAYCRVKVARYPSPFPYPYLRSLITQGAHCHTDGEKEKSADPIWPNRPFTTLMVRAITLTLPTVVKKHKSCWNKKLPFLTKIQWLRLKIVVWIMPLQWIGNDIDAVGSPPVKAASCWGHLSNCGSKQMWGGVKHFKRTSKAYVCIYIYNPIWITVPPPGTTRQQSDDAWRIVFVGNNVSTAPIHRRAALEACICQESRRSLASAKCWWS